MPRITPFHIIPALIAAASHAGEVTIEPRPFFVEKSFTASVLPGGECVLLRVDPKAWKDFSFLEILPHGSVVSKGDTLVRFDPEAIERKIEDTRNELAAAALSLEQAERDAKLLEETSAYKLEGIRRAAETAKEENTYFTQIRRKATEDSATQALKRSEQMLANQREELKQLSKMYEADDITENTEEIILVRQQDAVASAEFALRMEMLDHKRTLEVALPRQAKTLADSERDTAIALKKAEADIPRAIELSKLALQALKTANQRARQDLTELEADRLLFEFKAPAAGQFYHGPIENGRWTVGDLAKSLVTHGRAPTHAAFATFVPGAARPNLVAFIDEAASRTLKPDLTALATLAGREDLEIPVKISKIAPAPGPDGSYRIDLTASWPKELTPVAGATAQVRLISYQQAAAIVVPNKALAFAANGWTVDVKLADGKTEARPVKRGRVSKEETEILSGLEIGQVVVVPEK
jgi:multidrug efflux pump subunit AcrA (membrane-fusion protein)